MTYQTFDTVPAHVTAEWDGNKLLNKTDGVLLWSGAEPVPAIGAEIIVGMNRIGAARVKGYFSEAGWLGLLCDLHNPPDWHAKQNNGDRTGHIFGIEFRLA